MPRDLLAEQQEPRDLFAAPKFSQIDSALLGAAQGVTLGFGDEAAAAINGIVAMFGGEEGFIDAYKRARGDTRAMLKEAENANPKTFMASEFAGGIAPALIPGGQVVRGATMAQKIGRGVGGGIAYGGLAGAGAGEGLEDTVGKAAQGAVIGAGVGAAAPILGAGAGRIAQRVREARAARAAAKQSPSVEALNKEVQNLYSTLNDAGIEYSPRAFAQMVDGLEREMQKRFKRRITERAYGLLDDLKDDVASGRPPDFGDLNALSIQIGDEARALKGTNRAALFSIKDHINRFEKDAPFQAPAGLSRGDVNAFRRQARDMAFRKKKSEIIEEAITKSGFYKSGDESGLSNQFLGILKNPAKRNLFTKAEQKALRNVGKGTVGRNTLEMLGKFGLDPSKGGSTRSMLGLGSGATGVNAAVLGEPVTATIGLGLMGAGTIARPLARRGTKKAAERTAGMVRAGPQTVSNLAAKGNREALEQAAIAGQLSGNNVYQSRQPVTLTVARPTNIDMLAQILAGR